jgi:hypothetical protein
MIWRKRQLCAQCVTVIVFAGLQMQCTSCWMPPLMGFSEEDKGGPSFLHDEGCSIVHHLC